MSRNKGLGLGGFEITFLLILDIGNTADGLHRISKRIHSDDKFYC